MKGAAQFAYRLRVTVLCINMGKSITAFRAAALGCGKEQDSCNGGRAKTSMMTSRSSPAVHLPSSASVMPSGHHPESQSKGEQDAELQKAKQWTYNIQTLKRTIDCLYEICRQEHSVIGCKEALMYLSNSVRDFESLIETINVEVEWEAENK
ncbi:unnamed protein product [Toxocara canis]|uniref:SCAPER_N domain-containing protein n=1 Tax=Toxocara canis TaxID=6265 RepID=A0A183V3K5_TOXCA|nr:unnamed protein product [Toxocara canis]